MKSCLVFLAFFLYSLHSFAASDTLAVNTTWRGSVNVSKNTVIKKGVTLTILPGTQVLFGENVGLDVRGDLIVSGVKDKPVLMSTLTGGWSGIEFLGSSDESHSSKIDFAIIERVRNVGIYLVTYAPVSITNYDSLTISNSIIRYNDAPYTGGIRIGNSSTKISRCLIYKNKGDCGAIEISTRQGGAPLIENCTIAYNKGENRGIMYTDEFNRHSLEYLYATTSFPVTPKFRNCIFWGDKAVVSGGVIEMMFENCIIRGVSPSKAGVAVNRDPLFVDAARDDYSLRWDNYPSSTAIKSPAIDAAHYNTPNDPDGSPADIGAIPFSQAQGTFKPKADFTSRKTRGQAPFRVQFMNNSSAGTNKSLTYHWDFGDGKSSQERSPQHVYADHGTYSVSLTVKDAAGLEATLQLPDYIKSGTVVDEGYVEGVWTKANSPYLVFNDIAVDSLKSLQIKPGVEVEFQGEYELSVYGAFRAQGTARDKILFHAKDTAEWTQMGWQKATWMKITYKEGWGGINILDTSPLDTIRLSNCIIKNVGEFGRRSSYAQAGYRKFRFSPPLGALVAYKTTNLEIDSCTFTNNFVTSPAPTFTDSYYFFYGNPGIILGRSSGKITNCTFTDNLSHDGHMVAVYSSEVEIAHNSIYRNKPGIRSNIYLNASEARVHHNAIHDTDGGGVSIVDTYSPYGLTPRYAVYNNHIKRNFGGVVVSSSDAFVHIYSNWILENKGAYKGAGIRVENSSDVYVTGNVIAYNENNQQISNGGGGYYGDGKVIANNTIYGNRATDMGGGGLYTGTTGLIANNIIFGNHSWASGTAKDYVFYQYDPTSHFPDATLKNNLIGVDPSFGLQDSLDFSLRPNSVAIDKGTADTTGLYLPFFDILGSPRVDAVVRTVDVGAFEFRKTASAPSDISLSSRQVLRGQAFIGTLSAEDADKDDSHGFSIVSQEGARFSVSGSSLILNEGESAAFDSTEVTIRAVDSYGLSIEKQFTILGLENVTSVEDQRDQHALVLRPNPVRERLTVSVSKPTTLVIYSITGKQVGQERLQTGENQVDVRLLPPGVYIFDFKDLDMRRKIVKD